MAVVVAGGSGPASEAIEAAAVAERQLRCAAVRRVGAHVTAPLRFALTVPDLRVGFGSFAFDPVAQVLGAPLEQVLAPVMDGVVVAGVEGGARVLTYPLALAAGAGVSVPLGQYGSVDVHNDGVLLAVTVPAIAASVVASRLGAAVVRGPERTAAGIARVWIRVRPGWALEVPIPVGGLSASLRAAR
jgi:hypothetical protein